MKPNPYIERAQKLLEILKTHSGPLNLTDEQKKRLKNCQELQKRAQTKVADIENIKKLLSSEKVLKSDENNQEFQARQEGLKSSKKDLNDLNLVESGLVNLVTIESLKKEGTGLEKINDFISNYADGREAGFRAYIKNAEAQQNSNKGFGQEK